MKYILLFVIAGIVFLLVVRFTGGYGLTEEDLPPGYSLVCSVEGDKYSVRIPLGVNYPGRDFLSANVYSSIRKAIAHAISFEEFTNKRFQSFSDAYQWQDCEKGGE